MSYSVIISIIFLAEKSKTIIFLIGFLLNITDVLELPNDTEDGNVGWSQAAHEETISVKL